MIRKKPFVQTLAALALLTASATVPAADPQQPAAGGYGPDYYGMHPGMTGGYGMGYGMMGPGMMGMSPGMMMGPGMGMMGPGMGHGMMGMMDDDWDDDGMMGGRGMRGMGPGMMGMGPGMMGGYGPAGALNLDESQQKKITQIQDELRKKHWDLMGKMNDEQAKLRQLYYYSGQRDPAAIGKQYQRIQDLRRQMVESSIEAQNRTDAVLTPEQKEQMRRFSYDGRMW